MALACALSVVVFAVYFPTRHFGFIRYDDYPYVATNPHVQQGLSWPGVRWAFGSTVVRNWHPLTSLTSLVLSSLFGPSAATFHLANAALHALAVAMLYAFLRLATGRPGPALVAALLWGLHPLRVESVAWVAELKDELSSVTWLACLLAYCTYARRRTPLRYAAVFGLCALADLAKQIGVALPFVLLLVDGWPLGDDRPAEPALARRWWWYRALEKAPLLALSVATTWVAILTQASTSVLFRFPCRTRLANAVLSACAYLRQTFWPTDLGLFYPHPSILHHPIPAASVAAGLALLVGITAAVVYVGRRRPYLAVGWAWFLIVLLPVIGLLQAGEQARADRFTLLPSIGLTVAIVWLVADWAAPRRHRQWLAAAAAVAAALALTVCTAQLIPSWQDARSIWARADAVIPDNYMARANRSELALEAGDPATAERLARQAVAMAPNTAEEGHLALAIALAAQRRPTEALAEFGAAVTIRPTVPLIRYQAGLFLRDQGKDAGARQQLERAIKLDPGMLEARRELGLLLLRNHEYTAAAAQFRTILSIHHNDPLAEGELADALRQSNDTAGAVSHYAAAIALGSRNPEWEAQLAYLTARFGTEADLVGVAEPAKDASERAVDTDPFPTYAYALVLDRLGRSNDALAAARRALKLAEGSGRTQLAAEIEGKFVTLQRDRTTLPATGPIMPDQSGR